MKKLMIAAAIVCAAVASQAATAVWTIQATATIKDGAGASAASVANGLNVYIFDAGLTSQKAIYDLWAADQAFPSTADKGYVGSSSTESGKFVAANVSYGEQRTSSTDTSAYDYFFVIDGGDKIFLSATKTNNKANTSASPKTISWATATAIGDSTSLPVTGGVAGAWNTAAVPEPTSGLLLLGVAGLALRRRRA